MLLTQLDMRFVLDMLLRSVRFATEGGLEATGMAYIAYGKVVDEAQRALHLVEIGD